MFIINLTYKVDLSRVDEHLEAHVDYLKKQYENGNFLASGRKVPRTGGVILSGLTEQSNLMEIINKDPFKIHELLDCDTAADQGCTEGNPLLAFYYIHCHG